MLLNVEIVVDVAPRKPFKLNERHVLVELLVDGCSLGALQIQGLVQPQPLLALSDISNPILLVHPRLYRRSLSELVVDFV